jgi:predicted DNA-binding protein YlxM (UPF0122 family)
MKECSICTHSQLKDINQDLLNGVSVRKIAEKYGVTKSSVYRHQLLNCIGTLMLMLNCIGTLMLT